MAKFSGGTSGAVEVDVVLCCLEAKDEFCDLPFNDGASVSIEEDKPDVVSNEDDEEDENMVLVLALWSTSRDDFAEEDEEIAEVADSVNFVLLRLGAGVDRVAAPGTTIGTPALRTCGRFAN
jgi:hypothetical protein